MRLRYADALTTADNIMTFRTVIKEVAIEQGVYATFMPKPMAQGSEPSPSWLGILALRAL